MAFSLVLQAASSANGGGEGRWVGAAGPFICVFPDIYTYFYHLMQCARGKRREGIDDGPVVVGPYHLSLALRFFPSTYRSRAAARGQYKWGRESFTSEIERERGETTKKKERNTYA